MYIDREDLIKKEDSVYAEVLKREAHHNHKIIKDKNRYPRWEADPLWEKLVDRDLINLNDLIPKMCAQGMGKNSEEYRELYRKIGYSLYGYWEVFYWEVNNEEADQYNPTKKD